MYEKGADNPIFVGGVPRSGTTLLRVILDTHPRIHCGTELRVVEALTTLWTSADQRAQPLLSDAYGVDSEQLRGIFSELILSFLEPGRRASGKARVAEKTPFNVLVFPDLRRLFPNAALVHIIRDVRDVVASRLDREKAAAPDVRLDSVGFARARAEEWVRAMAVRRRMLSDAQLSGGYFELRYEALVTRPLEILSGLFDFLGETFDTAVLDFYRMERNVDGTEEWSAQAVRQPIFASSCGRWREVLKEPELSAVMHVAEKTLGELGYDAA